VQSIVCPANVMVALFRTRRRDSVLRSIMAVIHCQSDGRYFTAERVAGR
jgi:hypothetical protein